MGFDVKSGLYRYRGQVVRVVDGDTVDLVCDLGFYVRKRDRYRLLGYNAPEVRGAEREYGLIAKTYLENLIPHASIVYVDTYKADSFGRYLSDIWLEDGTNLVQKLLLEGYGIKWDGKGRRPAFDMDAAYPLID